MLFFSPLFSVQCFSAFIKTQHSRTVKEIGHFPSTYAIETHVGVVSVKAAAHGKLLLRLFNSGRDL